MVLYAEKSHVVMFYRKKIFHILRVGKWREEWYNRYRFEIVQTAERSRIIPMKHTENQIETRTERQAGWSQRIRKHMNHMKATIQAAIGRHGKRAVSAVLAGAVLAMSCVPASAATNTLTLHSSSPITSGATLSEYTWDIADGMVKAAVLEIDLTDPYVQLEVVPGQGKFTQRSTVTKMADRTDAIAMVNGDFYNTKAEGAPIGTTVIDGRLVSSQSYLTGVYCLGISSDRTAYIDAFSFEGEVTAANGESYGLSGLNKTFYWEETTGLHSHIGRLHLYSDLWGGSTRGMDSYVGTPAEVLIKNNRVTEVAFDGGFDTAVPDGCYILHGDGNAAEFLKNNMKVGDYVQIDYTSSPAKSWQMVIGGHALLVDQGKQVSYTKDLSALGGVRARTAAGISKDGKKVYIVAVEGRTSDSAGITLGNLSLLMTKLGVWKAVNLDGGGSTTMVSRPLGDTERVRIIDPERNGSERSVVEGLGVFSTAPAGSVKGISIAGSQTLLIGETATYDLRAYDQYYNPVTNTSVIELTEPTGLGTLDNGKFTASQAGTATLTAVNGSARATLPVTILGRDDISNLSLSVAEGNYIDGSTHQIKASVTLNDGTVKEVNGNALEWSVEGFDGTMDANGLLTISTVGDAKSGTVKASYDGFEGTLKLKFANEDMIQLTIDSKTLMKNDTAISMDVAPSIVNGRTMVPVRFIAEALDGMVDWDAELQTAYIAFNGNMVEMPVLSDIIYVNGEQVIIDTTSQIVNGRTMIPLRAAAEGLGLIVSYDNATRTITITQPE